MDLLDNIATELGFEFHLYVVRDQLFGSKQQRNTKMFTKTNKKQQVIDTITTQKQPPQFVDDSSDNDCKHCITNHSISYNK